MTDAQHQRTPFPVARLLAEMSGRKTADLARNALFALDLAAAPDTTLAPRWYGQQTDGSLADVLFNCVPRVLDGPWWCNPPFGATCRSCGGITPRKGCQQSKHRVVAGRCYTCEGWDGGDGTSRAGRQPARLGCRELGHDVVDLSAWAPMICEWARVHRGVVLCKHDTSTRWWADVQEAAEARVEFLFRVAYEVLVGGVWVARTQANFTSAAWLVGPAASGDPPVIQVSADGAVKAGQQGWEVLRARGWRGVRGPILAEWRLR